MFQDGQDLDGPILNIEHGICPKKSCEILSILSIDSAGGDGREGVGGGVERRLDVLIRVHDRDEARLERRGRQIDAALQHAVEEGLELILIAGRWPARSSSPADR
jgi:hypothetical protein